MSSIGPQMPAYLAKRKRAPDDEGANSPPVKQPRNADEIDLEDDSDDDGFGPSAPAAAPKYSSPAAKPFIGPAMPPSNTNEIALDDDSDSDDGYGPSAARATAQPEATKPKPSIGPSMPPKQPIGPARPPAGHQADADDSSSDSDDNYGPALPSSATSTQRAQAAAVAAAAAAAAAGPAAPQRDDWMLAPPTQSGYQERDPTKLKNRKFASGKSSAAGGSGGGISSIWTETPEQKRKRLEDAVLGRGDPTAGTEQQRPPRSREEEERDRRISEKIAASRGKSMYEKHQKEKRGSSKMGKGEEEEDDPSKRAFDREKDMALGSKIGTAQRRELLNHARDFGGRFQKGSYL